MVSQGFWITLTIAAWVRLVYHYFIFVPRVLRNARHVDNKLVLKMLPHVVAIGSVSIAGSVKLSDPETRMEDNPAVAGLIVNYFACCFLYVPMRFQKSAAYLHHKCRQMILEQNIEHIYVSPTQPFKLHLYMIIMMVMEMTILLGLCKLIQPKEMINAFIASMIPGTLLCIYHATMVCVPLRKVFQSFQNQQLECEKEYFSIALKRAIGNVNVLQFGVTFNCACGLISAVFSLIFSPDFEVLVPAFTAAHSTMELILLIMMKKQKRTFSSTKKSQTTVQATLPIGDSSLLSCKTIPSSNPTHSTGTNKH